MYAQEIDFPMCCGTKIIGYFKKTSSNYSWQNIKDFDIATGIGLAVATFSDEEEQKEAYEEMKNKFRIAWESGWIPNANMSNDTMVNLVVFETDTMDF